MWMLFLVCQNQATQLKANLSHQSHQSHQSHNITPYPLISLYTGQCHDQISAHIVIPFHSPISPPTLTILPSTLTMSPHNIPSHYHLPPSQYNLAPMQYDLSPLQCRQSHQSSVSKRVWQTSSSAWRMQTYCMPGCQMLCFPSRT